MKVNPRYGTFWDRLGPETKRGCMEWLGSRNRKGYGKITVNKRSFSAHRVALMLHLGLNSISPTLDVMHLCNNPPCCNPKHLKIGTRKENIRQSVSDGTHASNSTHPRWNAKLKQGDLKVIRHLLARGMTQAAVARRYGVDQSTISKAIKTMRQSKW